MELTGIPVGNTQAGVGVLPCFIGDPDPALVRLTPVLAGASAEQWLLVHADLRNVPRVRIVMDALAELFRARRAEIEGAAEAPTRITEAAD